MEIITMINPYKQKLIDIVKKTSTEEVTIYVKNTLNLMTKKIMTLDNLYTTNRLSIAIRNCYKFYKNYSDDWLGEYIAITLYFVCLQTGIKEFGDEIENSSWFFNVMDKDDWSNIDMPALNNYDLYQMKYMFDKYTVCEQPDCGAFGIFTLSIVDAFIR